MDKLEYQKPTVIIIEFELNDSIASSSDNGSDLVCNEGVFD